MGSHWIYSPMRRVDRWGLQRRTSNINKESPRWPTQKAFVDRQPPYKYVEYRPSSDSGYVYIVADVNRLQLYTDICAIY